MPMYALGVTPLIADVASADVVQEWYADDSSAGGRLRPLRRWWDDLNAKGSDYGYFLNATKSILLVKPEAYE